MNFSLLHNKRIILLSSRIKSEQYKLVKLILMMILILIHKYLLIIKILYLKLIKNQLKRVVLNNLKIEVKKIQNKIHLSKKV